LNDSIKNGVTQFAFSLALQFGEQDLVGAVLKKLMQQRSFQMIGVTPLWNRILNPSGYNTFFVHVRTLEHDE
jgi:hypothetical protein